MITMARLITAFSISFAALASAQDRPHTPNIFGEMQHNEFEIEPVSYRVWAKGEAFAPSVIVDGELRGGSCVVGFHEAITARHVLLEGKTEGELPKKVFVILPTIDGRTPVAIEMLVYNDYPDKDIVKLRVPSELISNGFIFPVVNRIAKKLPELGSLVRVLFNSPAPIIGKSGFGFIPITGVFGGLIKDPNEKVYLVVKSDASPGSSGTCILDEKGDVIGISTIIRSWGVDGSNLVFTVTLGEILVKR